MRELENNSSIGQSWDDFEKEVFTPEESAESHFRIALISEIIKARLAKGISQKQLEQLSGVKQPIIARMENGTTNPRLSTIIKILGALGKTLYIGDLSPKNN